MLALAVFAAATSADLAAADQAQPPPAGQSGQSSQERQSEVRRKQGEVALEVNTLEARNADITNALRTLETNVADQEARSQEAGRAAAAAAEDVVEAEGAVRAAQGRVDELDAASDQVAIEAYMNPPSVSAMDVFSADSVTDASLKQNLLAIQTAGDADVLDQLTQAHEDLELEEESKRGMAAEADRKRVEASDALARVLAAREQQAQFAAEAEAALDHKLIEASNLADQDAELSRQIAEEQAAIARQLEATRRAAEEAAKAQAAALGVSIPEPQESAGTAGPGSITPAPGGTASVSCPGGGSITVAGDVAPGVLGLVDAAAADGVHLCGSGFRNPERQIELRRQNCGSSDYAVWQASAATCSPPTARPGTSMHEQGLAIDFTCGGSGISSRSSGCYSWLAANAARYGLYNLPSEPWHWSTTGR